MNKNICYGILFCGLSLYALDMDNHAELSYVQTSGNSNATTIASKLQNSLILSDVSNLKSKATLLYSKSESETSGNKYDLELDYNHTISGKLYSYVGINYIKDRLSDYDYRLNIGPGLGYEFIKDEKQSLDLQSGFDYAYDRYINGQKDSYLANRGELNYAYKIQKNLQIKQMLNYLVSLEDAKKYFASSESALNVSVLNGVSMGVSYRIDYTNQTEKNKTDNKFLTSLLVDF